MSDTARRISEAYDASYPPSIFNRPVVVTLAPSTIVATAQTTVRINGSGFDPSSVVMINGVDASTIGLTPITFIDATAITFVVGIGELNPGTVQVGVDGSNTRPLTVTATVEEEPTTTEGEPMYSPTEPDQPEPDAPDAPEPEPTS